MKRVQIDLDTALRPRAVAQAVWEEASLWLGQPLPRRWLRELIAEANTVYAHNTRFRRKLRADGDSGREWLWLFARHWLAALIHERRSHLHQRLPASFNRGEPLGDKRTLPSFAYVAPTIAPRPERAVQQHDESWALAAHFYS
jgi:hypothetical protein